MAIGTEKPVLFLVREAGDRNKLKFIKDAQFFKPTKQHITIKRRNKSTVFNEPYWLICWVQ